MRPPLVRPALLTRGGAPEHHTLWEGYSVAEATWEPAQSFAGYKELLATFERELLLQKWRL